MCGFGQDDSRVYVIKPRDRSGLSVSVAPAPDAGLHFICASCDGQITKSHITAQLDREISHFCNAKCYSKWRKR